MSLFYFLFTYKNNLLSYLSNKDNMTIKNKYNA